MIVSKNSVDDLSQAMKYVIENPIEAEKMGRNAKEICKTKSFNNIIDKWEEYLSNFITER